MRRYVIRRLLQAVLMMFMLSIGFFTLIHLIPGGPDAVIGAGNPRITDFQRSLIRKRFGLDKPAPLQYLNWLGQVLRGNFEYSYISGEPVSKRIADRLPATLELFLAALIFALLVAITLGILAAVRQYSLTDYVITIFAYAGISMPIFWFAFILQTIFGVQLHILPTDGQHAADRTGFNQFQILQDQAIHLILPGIVLSVQFIAVWSRYLRSSLLDVIKQDYIRTARMKGLSSFRVFTRHALRNGLIPLVTVVALAFGGITGGAVVTETVFSWPGMGQLFIQSSIDTPDYPVLLAFLLLGAAMIIIFNLVADILYGLIDPRIRYS